jgi:hypothetical protein
VAKKLIEVNRNQSGALSFPLLWEQMWEPQRNKAQKGSIS